MTRAFTPPETLSKDDIRTLGDVRRDIWTNSFQGIAFGSGSGLVLHTTGQWMKRFGYLKTAKLGRNTMMLSILGGGALGSFLFAVKTGKEEVHNLHPIFRVGAMDTSGKSNYNERALQRKHANDNGDDDDNITKFGNDETTKELRDMRVVRRRTLMDSLRHGRGLSDSHGGHWVDHQHGGDNGGK
mmetsp:Transcript_23057/g.65345  ORF Transcript_23057/g.65345 Transcript_23057/m.65345 type:complete len:185 (+) Transcript_23057:228-782(+)